MIKPEDIKHPRLIFTPSAGITLQEICDYINTQPDLEARVKSLIRIRDERLKTFPENTVRFYKAKQYMSLYFVVYDKNHNIDYSGGILYTKNKIFEGWVIHSSVEPGERLI